MREYTGPLLAASRRSGCPSRWPAQEAPDSGEYVVFRPLGGQGREYWLGSSTGGWSPDANGRLSAARFPDMHAARAAFVGAEGDEPTSQFSYEFVPLKVEQLDLLPPPAGGGI